MKQTGLRERILSVFLACILAAGLLPANALAGGADYWPNFRRTADNMAVVNTETPTGTESAALKWATALNSGFDNALAGPVLVGDSLYALGNGTLCRLNPGDGSVTASAPLAAGNGFNYFLTGGGGKIFVQEGTRVQAFDADTLNALWISAPASGGSYGMTPLFYADGRLYGGTIGFTASSAGTYFCIDVTDENPGSSDETKHFTWEFTPASTGTYFGFYWAGAVKAGNAVLFGSEGGVLYALDSGTGAVLDTFSVPDGGDIRSSVSYSNQTAYFTTKTGYVWAVPVDEATGTLDGAGAISGLICEGAVSSTSTPAVSGGRVYVGASTASGGAVGVLSANDLSQIYAIPAPGGVQSSVLLTTGYAREGDGKVYGYATYNAAPGSVLWFRDTVGQTAAVYGDFGSLTGAHSDYNACQVIADAGGTLYFGNDSGYLMALEPKSGQADETAPLLSPGTAARNSDANAVVTFASTEAGTFYYAVSDSGAPAAIDTAGVGTAMNVGQNTLSLSSLAAGAKTLSILAKDAAGNLSELISISIPEAISGSKTVTLRVEGMSENLYYGTAGVPYTGNLTVLQALRYFDAASDAIRLTIDESAYGAYVSAVNGVTAQGLGHYDGWCYLVEGAAENNGISVQSLNEGDTVVLYYGDPWGVGMQYPQVDTGGLSAGVLAFTSQDTVYDEFYNPSVVTRPVAGATVTWHWGSGQTATYTTDENGRIIIHSPYLTPGSHVIQIEKYQANGLPLALRLPPGYSVNAASHPGGGGDVGTVTVSFTLLGTDPDGESGTVNTYAKDNLTAWIPRATVTMDAGATVLDLFRQVLTAKGYQFSLGGGGYVQSVTTPEGVTLGEYDNGTYSGWMYQVDGVYPNIGMANKPLSPGDKVICHYSDDYRREDGANVDPGEGPVPGDPSSPTAEAELTAVLNAGTGMAAAALAGDTLADWVGAVQANGGAALLTVALPEGADALTLTLPGEAVEALCSAASTSLTVRTALGSVTFDLAAVRVFQAAGNGGALILTLAAESTAGGIPPALRFSAAAGGTPVTDLGDGLARISLPYSLQAGEEENAVFLYSPETDRLVRSGYRAGTQTVEGETRRLSAFAVGYDLVTFTDVPESAWYRDAAVFLAARNVALGTGDGRFSPRQPMNRGAFIVLLLRACGIAPDEAPVANFTDAGSTYYTGYLAAALRLGIADGTGDGRFAPEATLTRQDMCVLISRALDWLGSLSTEAPDNALAAFSDAGDVSGYAQSAMAVFAANGILSGFAGRLNPLDPAGRDQAALVLYRLLAKEAAFA